MQKDTLILLTPPQQLVQAAQWQGVIAHHCYRIGSGFRLLRSGAPSLKGGLMVISDTQTGVGPFRPSFCHEVLQECTVRGFSGILLDFDCRLPTLCQCAAGLNTLCTARHHTLYVPEYYANAAPNALVLISSAISGGSLAVRLSQASARFDPERVVLALQRVREDFSLPAPSGSGVSLSQSQLEQILSVIHPNIFFSSELCARYFTYLDHEQGAHFVLFDDLDTLLHKIQIAHRCGIHTILAPWSEVCPAPRKFGLLPTHCRTPIGKNNFPKYT